LGNTLTSHESISVGQQSRRGCREAWPSAVGWEQKREQTRNLPCQMPILTTLSHSIFFSSPRTTTARTNPSNLVVSRMRTKLKSRTLPRQTIILITGGLSRSTHFLSPWTSAVKMKPLSLLLPAVNRVRTKERNKRGK
jgi:hypothetical protein